MFRTPPATVLVQARPRDELVRRQTRRRDPAAPERKRLGSRSAPPFPSLRYETFPEVGQNGRHNKGGVGSRVGAGWWMSVGREARVEQVEVEEGKGAQRRLQEERGSASALAGECGRSGRTSSPSLVHPRREKSRASMQSFEVALAARRAWRRCLMSAAGCTRWCGQAGCARGASRGWLTRASGDEESNPRREDDTLLVVVASRFPRPLRRLSQSSHAREHHLDRLRRPVRLLGRAPRPPDPARLRPPPPPDRLVLRLAAQPSRPARGRGRLAAHPRPGSGTQLGRHRGGQAGQDGRRLGSLRPLIVPRSSPSSRPLGLSCSPRQLADFRSCNRKPSSRSPSCATSRRRRRRPSRSSRRSCSTRASCASHRRTSPACARTAPSASRRTTRSRPWTGSASRSTARSTSRTRSGGRTTSCARSSRATGSARTPGTRRQRCAPFPSARSPFSSPS